MNHEQIVPISKGRGNRVGLLLLPSLLHLFLLTLPAQAQTAAISGHVFDAADRRSLPGAHLHLLQAADSSLLVSTMADMDGNFALKLPDTTAPLLLKATYLGYADRYTAIEGDTPLEIEMQARDYAIGGVVVKAPLFQRKSDRFVFNVSAAPWLAGTDAAAILQHTPLVISSGNDKLNIVGKSRTAIRINGKDPHMSQDALMAYLRSVPSEEIRRIEVITVPGSEYAASCTGGIINVVIREQTDSLKGSLRLEDRQNRFVNNPGASLNLNFRRQKVSLAANLWGGRSLTCMENASEQNVFETQTDIRSFGRNKQGGGYVGGKIGLDYEISPRHTLGLHFSRSYRANRSDSRADHRYSRAEMLDSLTCSRSESANPVNQTSASISCLFDIVPSRHRLTMDVSYSNNRRTGDSFTYSDRMDENGAPMYRNSDFIQRVSTAIDAWSGRMDYQWNPSPKSTLKSGLALFSTATDNDTFFGLAENDGYVNDPSRTNHFVYDETIGAAYVSYHRAWSDSFETTLGLRGEYMHNAGHQYVGDKRFSNSRFNLFPTVILGYKGVLSYSLSGKIRRPGFNDLNPFRHYFSSTSYVENNPFLQSSPSLVQELSCTLKDHYIFQASYTVNYDAWAQFVVPEENNVMRYTLVNYGNSQEFGFNFVYTKSFFNGVWNTTNTLAYAYSHFKGNPLGREMNTDGSSFWLMSMNTFTLSKQRKWYCDLSFFLDTPCQDTDTRFEGSQLLSVGLRKQIAGWSFTVKMQDLLNRGISRATTVTDLLRSYDRNDLGRRELYVVISCSFGNKKVKGQARRHLSGKGIEDRM